MQKKNTLKILKSEMISVQNPVNKFCVALSFKWESHND